MEKDMLELRSMGDRTGNLQYLLAAVAIWAAIGLSLYAQAHPPAETNTVLLALQPLAKACNPS
jgi:hypothetical protein